MTIEKIHINSFGGLSDTEIELSGGVNIVEGPNEAGKSTISAFIAWVLYGFDRAEKSRRTPLDGSVCSGFLTVYNDGERYSIARRGNGEASITELSTQRLISGAIPGELFLGVPRDIFIRTAYISQYDGAYIDGADIRDSMENLLYSADEKVSVTKAQKKLDELRVSLLHKNGKGGRLYDYKIERDRLTARLQKATEGNRRVIELEGSLREAKAVLTSRSEELESCRRSIEFYDTVSKLSAIDSVAAFNDREAKVISGYNDVIAANTCNGFAPDSGYIESVKTSGGELERLNEEIASLDAEIKRESRANGERGDIARRLEAINEFGGRKALSMRYRAAKSRSALLGIIAAVLLVLSAAGSLAAFFMYKNDNSVPALVFAAAALAGVAAAVILLLARRKPSAECASVLEAVDVADAKALYSLLDGSEEDEIAFRVSAQKIDSLHDRRDAAVERADEKRAELNRMLALWNSSSAEEAVARAEKFVGEVANIKHELDVVRSSREALRSSLGEYDEESLRRHYAELKEVYLPVVKAGGFDISELRKRESFLGQAEKAMTEKVGALEKELAALKAITERPAPISDAIYALDGRITVDGERYKACVLAYKMLTEASEEIRDSVSPRISRSASEMMAKATAGRYDALGVDSGLAVTYNLGGRAVDASYMSEGTRDLAYISLRLALTGVLCANRPPVIFDESFARLDDERLEAALRLVYGCADGGNQAVLFTCRDRDAAVMEKIGDYSRIVLDAKKFRENS